METQHCKPACPPRDRVVVALYMVIACLMSTGLGYTLGSSHSQSAMVDLATLQTKERAAINRTHRAEVKELKRLINQ